ncbi:MAG TPA: YqzL family protein [Bacillales bacterium]|nr:YqzL family protein [Bacillales bacterium]
MLDLTWKVFCMTGDVNTYLLLKQLEQAPNDQEAHGSVYADSAIDEVSASSVQAIE